MSDGRNMPFSWNGLRRDIWEEIIAGEPVLKVKKHNYLFQIGERNDFIYFVCSGKIALELASNKGSVRAFLIATDGHFFAESNSILQVPPLMGAKAATNSVVCPITWARMQEKIEKNPNILYELYRSSLSKMRSITQQIEMLSFTKPLTRVKGALHWCFNAFGEPCGEGAGWRMRVSSFSHQDISYMTGHSRVAVSNAFLKLYESHTIEKKNGYYYVKSLDDLL